MCRNWKLSFPMRKESIEEVRYDYDRLPSIQSISELLNGWYWLRLHRFYAGAEGDSRVMSGTGIFGPNYGSWASWTARWTNCLSFALRSHCLLWSLQRGKHSHTFSRSQAFSINLWEYIELPIQKPIIWVSYALIQSRRQQTILLRYG